KSVLITGCTVGGIGHALAHEFLAKGYRVFATARHVESMGNLERSGAITLPLDVTDEHAIRRLHDQVSATTGGTLDILVNNADAHCHLQAAMIPAIEMPMSDTRTIFDVNFFGPVCMIQEFVHLLIASGDGRILNISSVGAVMPLPFCAIYNATKAALVSLGNTLR
ncbi:uncharacterized protein C8Q71DRAFT_695142, partial [Rhodofomes roseus]